MSARHLRRPESCFAMIAGGGTAGHVLPALAIAEALVAGGHPREAVQMVGSARGLEARLYPEAGFPTTLLPGRGIERRLSLQNLRSVTALLTAFLRAWRLVGKQRPKVVVSVGGYASLAVGLVAAVRRVPIVVAEQNAAPGAANRWVGRFAKACAVSFPDTALPRAVVTGNPVRPEIAAIAHDREAARHKARYVIDVYPGRRVVLVMGGSLGALRINQAVLAALPRWAGRTDLHVRHVVGRRDWDVITGPEPPLPPGSPLRYQAVQYEDDMTTALASADLVVCRAGSSTCFELLAAGLPSILVPSPNVTADHQNANARHMAAAGAAVVVPDGELDGERLVTEVDQLLFGDPHRLQAMAVAARGAARPRAAHDIAALAQEHARA